MAELNRIVHVDDDEDILEIARMALQLVDNFDLVQYKSGEEAVAHIDADKPDLLLLDFMMPGMTGPELWKHAQALPNTKSTPVIFMTAKAELQLSDDLRAQGALEVITKPFDPMTLGAQIRHAWTLR